STLWARVLALSSANCRRSSRAPIRSRRPLIVAFSILPLNHQAAIAVANTRGATTWRLFRTTFAPSFHILGSDRSSISVPFRINRPLPSLIWKREIATFARRPTMLEAALKALEQLLSPPFRSVLLKSIALALVLLLALGIGLHRVIAWVIGGG